MSTSSNAGKLFFILKQLYIMQLKWVIIVKFVLCVFKGIKIKFKILKKNILI